MRRHRHLQPAHLVAAKSAAPIILTTPVSSYPRPLRRLHHLHADFDSDPYAVSTPTPTLDPDPHADSDSDPHADSDSDPDPHADSDPDPDPDSDSDSDRSYDLSAADRNLVAEAPAREGATCPSRSAAASNRSPGTRASGGIESGEPG